MPVIDKEFVLLPVIRESSEIITPSFFHCQGRSDPLAATKKLTSFPVHLEALTGCAVILVAIPELITALSETTVPQPFVISQR